MTKARDLANIISGGFTADDIPNISTDKLTSGTLPDARIAAVSASKLTGSIAGARIDNNSLANVTALPFSAGTDWQSSIKTSNFTASAGDGYFVNTAGGAFEIDLPGSPSVGDEIEFVDFTRNFATANLTLDQGSNKFQGQVASAKKPVYDLDGQGIRIVFSGSTQGWIPTVDDDVTDETDISYPVISLVLAGGGSGGYNPGNAYGSGGGGSGGYRSQTLALVTGTSYTITVGDGGTSNTSSSANGSNSSISGSDITTITSAGGGKGGHNNAITGSAGGSGGGAKGVNNSGAAGNTPSTSPSQGNTGGNSGTGGPNGGGGGGGGAGAVGGNGSTTNGGTGGAGVASSITGSAVTRGGGGGGATYSGGSEGSGGSGGGGAGSASTGSGVAGTANLGAGGGGAGAADAAAGSGGNGGKGVVILSMADAKYTGTVSGSPTVATGVSGQTVLTFTGSGSYTG